MQWRNSTEQYGFISKLLHWSIAILMIYTLIAGFSIPIFNTGEARSIIIMLNQSIGLCVFPIMLFRWFWVRFNPTVALPNTLSTPEKYAARSVQTLLYILIFAIIISGLCMLKKPFLFFGLFPIHPPLSTGLEQDFKNIHRWVLYISTIVIILHGLAALKHHFIDKDDVLKSML